MNTYAFMLKPIHEYDSERSSKNFNEFSIKGVISERRPGPWQGKKSTCKSENKYGRAYLLNLIDLQRRAKEIGKETQNPVTEVEKSERKVL